MFLKSGFTGITASARRLPPSTLRGPWTAHTSGGRHDGGRLDRRHETPLSGGRCGEPSKGYLASLILIYGSRDSSRLSDLTFPNLVLWNLQQ